MQANRLHPVGRSARAPAAGAAFALGAAPAGALAAVEGGYFASTWGWTALALLLVAAGAAVVRDRLGRGPLALTLTGTLLALAAWSASSAIWSPGAQAQVLDAQRLLVYAAAAAAFLAVVRSGEVAVFLGGVLASAVAVCGWALLHRPGPDAESQQLAEPIGYWNALALVAVIGILLAAGLALTSRPTLARAAAASALVVLLPALYLTYSRGGWLALGAGVLATAALRARRRLRLAIAAALVAVAAASLALGGLERARAAFASPIEATAQEDLSARLGSLSGNGRAEYWRVAWLAVEDEPLLGAGAGSFERYWAQHRPNAFYARDAHNLFLEALAELGPLGLLLVLVVAGAPVAGALRGPPLAAHAAGAWLAFLAHALVDWGWEIPAVAVPALACACAAVRLAEPRERPLTAPVRAGVVVLAVPLAAFAFAAQVGNSRISRAEAAVDAGEYAQASALAAGADGWAPWSAEPERIGGVAALASGDDERALALLREAVREEPARWDLWWTLAAAGSGEARAELERLNPRAEPPAG